MQRPAIDNISSILLTRPISMNKFKQPYLCEVCSAGGETEVLVELENVTSMHRFCNPCLSVAEF